MPMESGAIKQSSRNSVKDDKMEESERQDDLMTHMNPEIEAISHEKELRVDTMEQSAYEDNDMASDPNHRSRVNGLSPITRKSEREHKNIDYDKLNKGANG
jgi:hypothetical protein